MKVVYNSKEIINNTNDYNGLLNRPMINSVTLEGVKTISDINTYTKEQIDELIGNSRSIEIVTALPTNLIENTLYYVGPDANDFYDVYLVDEVRNVFNIGTSQFGEYFAGTGIDIDADNYVSTLIDNKTIIVDSENNLHASLNLDSVPVFVGTGLGITPPKTGVKGLVPAPGIGSQIRSLRAVGTWDYLLNSIYPVGTYIFTDSVNHNPNDWFPGSYWVQASDSRVLWTGTSYALLAAGAPNIKGSITYPGWYDGWRSSNLFKKTRNTTTQHYTHFTSPGNGFEAPVYRTSASFDAAKGTYKTDGTKMAEEDSPYGKSDTVQPPAIKICCWQRAS